jgi:hypothetical protein
VALRYLEIVVLVVPALPVSPWLLLLDIPAALAFTGALALLAWLAPVERALASYGVALKR